MSYQGLQTVLDILGDPTVAPLTIAHTASSLTLFGSILLELVGPVAIARNKLGPVALKTNEKVKTFSVYSKRVGPVLVVSSLLSIVGTAVVGRTSTDTNIQFWSYLSAWGSLLIHLYTVVFLLPTNNELLKLGERAQAQNVTKPGKGQGAGGGAGLSEAELKRAEELIEKWSTRHPLRFVGYILAWLGSFVAFTLAVAATRA